MDQEQLKQLVAEAALENVRPDLHADVIIGIGTGSTANKFIDALEPLKTTFRGAVSSSQASTDRLQAMGIEVFDLNEAGTLGVYVDGADEANHHLELIKGGGAALTREKIVAACSEKFICIADGSKYVETMGTFPLPVEVIPMARGHVARELVKLGGDPVYREGVVTDNGNVILDVHNMQITDAVDLEIKINAIVGVVTSGLFAQRPADLLLLGTEDGVKEHSVINLSAEDGKYY